MAVKTGKSAALKLSSLFRLGPGYEESRSMTLARFSQGFENTLTSQAIH